MSLPSHPLDKSVALVDTSIKNGNSYAISVTEALDVAFIKSTSAV